MKLPFEMQVRCGDEGMDARPFGPGDRFAGPLDIGGVAPRKACDDRPTNLAGDQPDRVRVVLRGDRETSLDDIDPQRLELPG